jgi:hypothetical protein
LRDNIGAPDKSYGTNLSSSFQGKAENDGKAYGSVSRGQQAVAAS